MNMRKDSELNAGEFNKSDWSNTLLTIGKLRRELAKSGVKTPALKKVSLYLGQIHSSVLSENPLFEGSEFGGGQ